MKITYFVSGFQLMCGKKYSFDAVYLVGPKRKDSPLSIRDEVYEDFKWNGGNYCDVFIQTMTRIEHTE